MFSFLSDKFSHVLRWVGQKTTLTEENIAQAVSDVRTALLDSDIPLGIVEKFLEELKQAVTGAKIIGKLNPGEQFIKTVHDTVLTFLGGKNALTAINFQLPSVILVMGLQGSGKTTTIGKLAHLVLTQAKAKGKTRRILLASVDYYRPAAIDQLEILSNQVGVDFYRAKSSSPVEAAQEICNHFKAKSYELLFLDTAGRLHVDTELMDELKQINKIAAPKHKILVLDAMTGQESLSVAQSFNEAVGFEAAIMSKMDSDTRAGAAFAFKYALNKPIAWVGTGEKIDDLEPFHPERMTSRILGMGDLQSLLEKAEASISQEKQASMTQRFMEGNFTLKDFYEQLAMVDSLGSLQKISRYLPGAGNISPEMMEQGQREMKRFKAIISSMTEKERMIPGILDGSRKKRIAQGAGVNTQDINQLLERFEQSKQFAKMFKKMGKLKRFF